MDNRFAMRLTWNWAFAALRFLIEQDLPFNVDDFNNPNSEVIRSLERSLLGNLRATQPSKDTTDLNVPSGKFKECFLEYVVAYLGLVVAGGSIETVCAILERDRLRKPLC
jgi:hypothetical protein